MKASVVLILLWALGGIVASQSIDGSLDGNSSTTGNGSAVHSRRKRYIVFPKGTSLQILLEVLSHVPTRFKVFVGPTLQLAWPLPSEPFEKMTSPSRYQDLSNYIFDKPVSSRSSEFSAEKESKTTKYRAFNELADFLSSFGMTVGLAWQLPDDPKIYAESKKKHKIYKRNVLKKMESFMKPNGANGKQCVLKALCESGQRTPAKKEFLREILHKIFSFDEDDEDENHEDKIYRKAHQSINQNCKALYPECGFSVFDAIK